MLGYKNRKIYININELILFAALCVAGLSVNAAEDVPLIGGESDISEQLTSYQQQIEDLEYEFGPYHSSLIEPLQSMIDLLNERQDYEQVAQLQNRQLQVMRTELGFEHPDLIPLLQSIMATQLALGNWEEISDQLDHIRHLQASIDEENAELLLDAIQDQIDWLYSRISVDDRREQVRNFFKIRDFYEEIEDIVEATYGEESPEAAPWLYKVAYNEYHLVQFLNAPRGLGSETIDQLVRREGTFGLDRSNRSSFRFYLFLWQFIGHPSRR